MQRRTFVTHTLFGIAGASAWIGARAAAPSAVIVWNGALKAAIATTATQATIAARAISMVHEAIYNAWAGYDAKASFTLAGLGRRPVAEWTDTWKSIAIAQAAHMVLKDLFPTQATVLDQLLAAQVPAAGAATAAGQAAVAQGRAAGRALLNARYYDGANQLGNLAAGAYADWTGYVPVNTPELLIDPARWQPLRVPTAAGGTAVQKYLTPHWGLVRPFALASGSVFRPLKPAYGTPLADMQEVLDCSAGLTDHWKSLVHYWAANPGTVSPPGQWTEIAEVVSAYDANTLDDDVKLFFTVGQAMLDASIAAWDCKRAYDSVRPISAIRYYFRNQTIRGWLGDGQEGGPLQGQNWRPYQRLTNPTPPFPEYVSGHSTFSRAGAWVISGLRGADTIPLAMSVRKAEIAFDADTPAAPVTFTYRTLSEAAQGAGVSRIWGGIHFGPANVDGRELGRRVGETVLAKARLLFQGR